jgi:hypothetical protein
MMRSASKFWSEIPKGRPNVNNVGIDAGLISKLILVGDEIVDLIQQAQVRSQLRATGHALTTAGVL